jgi:hypothetical protein
LIASSWRDRQEAGSVAEIVNLRMVRKARKRSEAAAVADSNRARFGRGRAERAAAEVDEARRQRLLDGARRDGE